MNDRLRIVSLAPTQTEIVAALGMLASLVGVSEDCDYPGEVKKIERFGSWYSPAIARVVEAGPDLVFTFGSHQEEIAAELLGSGLEVYHSEPKTIAASLSSMGEIAEKLGRQQEWARLSTGLENRLARVKETVDVSTATALRPRVFRIMNWSPLITVSAGAFQHDVIEFSGGQNIAAGGPAPYYVCNPEIMRNRDPEIIFFCEPNIRGFLKDDPEWQKVDAVRHNRVHVFDCGLTCRSGPRIVDMAEELSAVIRLYRDL